MVTTIRLPDIPARKKRPVEEQTAVKLTPEAYNTLVDIYNESTLSLKQIAMQAWCGAKQDGHIGPATISAIQRKLGCAADGCFSGPSPAIKALQRWINQQ